jgi:hypothetical protein
MLDDGLAKLQAYWDGEFEPRPVQQPRIPVWLAAKWPNRKPLRRAARWDGFFPIYMPGVDEFAEMAAEVRELRNGDEAPFDLVVTNPPGTDLRPWEAAGATWCLTGFDAEPRRDVVESVIEEGP